MPRKSFSQNNPRPALEALGQSDSFLAVQERIYNVAKVDRPVLILGERGTGKELASTRVHYLSKRWEHAFVTLNCAGLAPSLIESELFGHEAGAFTGARERRKGRFEIAHEGTLFLDEIGNMPEIVQEKILRVIEYGSFERVGGSAPVFVDVRIVAATNADMQERVDQGSFKKDLLDRLSFEVITLPPLRERREDIVLLAHHFAARMAVELNLPEAPGFSDSVINRLNRYPWPGNIRELKNAVERAVYRSGGATIENIKINPFASISDVAVLEEKPDAAGANPVPERAASGPPRKFKQTIEALEVRLLKESLSEARFNQRRAARNLGLSYHQFRGLYRKYRESLR